MIISTLPYKVEGVRNAETSQDIQLSIVESGNIVCYDRLAVVNYDHTVTLFTVGFKYGATEHLVESFIPTVAGQVSATQTRIFVPGNYKPFVRVTGGTAGDRIALFAYGYISDKNY